MYWTDLEPNKADAIGTFRTHVTSEVITYCLASGASQVAEFAGMTA